MMAEPPPRKKAKKQIWLSEIKFCSLTIVHFMLTDSNVSHSKLCFVSIYDLAGEDGIKPALAEDIQSHLKFCGCP
jgi:hypothetical protein